MAKFNGFVKDYTGLSNQQVILNQTKYGKNILVHEKKENLFLKLISILKEPMFVLLFCTAILYFFLNEPQDGLTMLIFVLFIAGLNLWQEFKTEKALQALKNISDSKVRVIRNEKLESISSSEVTIDDFIIVQEGDKIQADGTVVEINGFGVNESVLTGESMVVWKNTKDNNENPFWKVNMCYAGTAVTNGSAIFHVSAIGTNTEYGKIGVSLSEIKPEPTNLEKGIKKLVKIATIISIALFIATFGFSLIQTKDTVESLLRAITLAMAMIPEEFPVILTIFLAVGATRLAKNHSLIRKLNSVETLGSISVLCVDKTGTLTKNEMNIEEVFCYESTTKNDLLYYSVLASETHPIDPMENAIHHYSKKNKLDLLNIYQNNQIHEYPFSSETRMMGHIWQIKKEKILAVKGAFESVIPLCNLSEKDKTQLNFTLKNLHTKDIEFWR
jgi:Ca2+-transporting ATPase